MSRFVLGGLLRKLIIIFILTSFCFQSIAGSRERAWKMHNRLAGVPPKQDVLDDMSAAISQGDPEAAAKIAMDNPGFYNITLKNWIKPWSNRERTPRIPMNDYVATILGVIRDDTPFDKILYDDILYIVDSAALPVYSNTDNNHYRNAETQNISFMDTLVARTQSTVTGLPSAAVAGVTTTRNAGENYFSAGTNRRVNRFIFMNYLCKDYEDLHDITVPDFRVARDVERNPGGDSRTYKNRCVGCHAGQDSLRGAYAYYNFSGNQLVYTQGQVQGKMNQNNYYPQGFVTTNDEWINLWSTGQNATVGWRGAATGNGAQSIGMMFAKSKAFSQCMAKKVFKLVCMRDVVNTADVTSVAQMATQFEANNKYSMKDLIAKTSAGCVINEN
jgi:hypothetical protein